MTTKKIGEINDQATIDEIAASIYLAMKANKPERLSELWVIGIMIICATALIIFTGSIPDQWADMAKWLGGIYIATRGGGKIAEKLNGNGLK